MYRSKNNIQMDNLALLYEHFPELYKPNLKKTYAKQWNKFINAFSELCLWIHCSRAVHKNGNGIVLFPTWWEQHLGNHHRWHFNVEHELSPYLITNGNYNYHKSISREWIVTENFKVRSINLISDDRFQPKKHWHHIIEKVISSSISNEKPIEKGFIKIANMPEVTCLNIESFLIFNSFADKLKAGFPVTYSIANNGRLHHPLQNLKKEYRNLIFKDWYSYDFKACAPSILVQEYHKLVPNSSLPSIEAFIQNRKHIRELIAEHTGIEKITVKRALTGLFFGQTIPTERQARWDISTTTAYEKFKFSLINMLGDKAAEKLLANSIFADIVIECQSKLMKEMSFFLKDLASVEDGIWNLINPAGALKQMPRWNTRQAVAHWYFGHERQIIDVVSDYLSSINANFLLIHDGFLSNKKVNIETIQQLILKQTSFNLELSEEKIK